MSKLTVKVPSTGARSVVARRQTLQVVPNRSVPAAVGDSNRPVLPTYPTPYHHHHRHRYRHQHDEFGARAPRSPRGARERDEPPPAAGTKIVDFGRTVELRPPRGTRRLDARGSVGPGGFFPPVKLRTGGAVGVRFTTSAGSGRSPKSPLQQSPSEPANPLNVELAPAKKTATGGDEADSSGRGSEEWLTSARTETMAKKHMLQDRPANPYNTRATAQRETFALKGSSPSPSEKALKPSALPGGPGAGAAARPRPSKDAAWVRSFKVKQRRYNRVKELLESKPAGLTVGSPVHADSYW